MRTCARSANCARPSNACPAHASATSPTRATPTPTSPRSTPLLADVDLLFIESVFLHADLAHAERKNHLTARQAGEIARRVRAKAVVPFHFSPRYEGRSAEVIAEVQAAWRG